MLFFRLSNKNLLFTSPVLSPMAWKIKRKKKKQDTVSLSGICVLNFNTTACTRSIATMFVCKIYVYILRVKIRGKTSKLVKKCRKYILHSFFPMITKKPLHILKLNDTHSPSGVSLGNCRDMMRCDID